MNNSNDGRISVYNYDRLFTAFKTRFAPTIADALKYASGFNLSSPDAKSITLPLQADVQVAYEKDMARFIIKGSYRASNINGKGALFVESYFGDKEILSVHDPEAYIEYVFENAKHQMLRMLSEGQLDELLHHLKRDEKNEQ